MAWEKIVKQDADVNDTIGLIVETINKYSDSAYVQGVCADLLKQSNGSLNKFLQQLFNYVCTKVKYQLDPVNQEKVTTPERLVRDGKGDCKKMSVYIASVLKCAGITPLLKVISYNGKNYEHIYVIVPNDAGGYITLDPVNNCKYNAEIAHVKERVIDLNNKEMELSLLGKPPANQNWSQRSGNIIYPYSQDRFLDYLSGSAKNVLKTGDMLDYLHGLVSELDGDISNTTLTTTEKNNFILLTLANFMAEQKNKRSPKTYSYNQTLGNVFDDWWQNIKDATSGLSETFKDTVANPTTWQNLLDGLKDVGSGALDFLKNVGLAPARGAFLLLLDVNFLGLATKIYDAWVKQNPAITIPATYFPNGQIATPVRTQPGSFPYAQTIKNWWTRLGGDVTVFRNSVSKGVSKSPTTLSGLGLDPVTITAASALVVSITQLLSTLGVLPAAEKTRIDNNVLAALKLIPTKTATPGTTTPDVPPVEASTGMGIGGYLLLGLGVTVAYKAVTKKR